MCIEIIYIVFLNLHSDLHIISEEVGNFSYSDHFLCYLAEGMVQHRCLIKYLLSVKQMN